MKKFIAVILAAIMIMSFATVAFATNGFDDVSKSRYETAINELYDLGIVNGYSKTKFGTTYTLTRAEACAMMVRAMYGEKVVNDVINFTDVSYRDWFYEYVNTAVYYDIMHGHNTTTFAPNDDITYDQFATLVLNALGYNAPKLAGDWPENVERIAVRLGLFNGISTYFDGTEAITRGEACQMLYNALDCYVVEYRNGRIVETDKTLYEAMGFSYEPEYLYVNGTITDIVNVSDYYHLTKTYYYLITIDDYNTYLVKSDTELAVKDYVRISTDKKTSYHDEYLWTVDYVSKNITETDYIEGIVEKIVVDNTKTPYDDGNYIWTTYFITIKDKGTFTVYTYNLFNTGDKVVLTPVVGSTTYNLTVLERATPPTFDSGFGVG